MTARISDKDSKDDIEKDFKLFDDEKNGFISIKNLNSTRHLFSSVSTSKIKSWVG